MSGEGGGDQVAVAIAVVVAMRVVAIVDAVISGGGDSEEGSSSVDGCGYSDDENGCISSSDEGNSNG